MGDLTPLAYLTFGRAAATRKCFERNARPEKLSCQRNLHRRPDLDLESRLLPVCFDFVTDRKYCIWPQNLAKLAKFTF